MISPAQSTDLAQQVSGLGRPLMRDGSRDKVLSTQPLTENKHSLTHLLALHGTYYNRRIKRKTR
jgi:hypothetical protein